jgi:hypothetical protein
VGGGGAGRSTATWEKRVERGGAGSHRGLEEQVNKNGRRQIERKEGGREEKKEGKFRDRLGRPTAHS